ncbi:MAG: hypothetical protein ACFUZC_21430 [Chthoniobacteraceae bacterium]
MKSAFHSGRGIALIISLAFIVMITVIIVSLATSMRTDRPAANFYSEAARASQFAQTGIDNVIGTLGKYASITSGTGTGNWISQPGQMVVSLTGTSLLSLPVPLNSGSAAASVTDPSFEPPNLNVHTFRDPNSLLISSGTTDLNMPVAWIYVRKSGTLDRSSDPTTSGTDPVVGRYAYWTDDESSKINYNIAWGRSSANTDPPGSVTKVDLTALSGMTSTFADAMRSAVLGGSSVLTGSAQLMGSGTAQQYSFFNTPQDARRVESFASGIAQVLRDNKFEITHYNHDPNTTFFNEPRIVLTTHPDRAGWTNENGTWVGVNGKTWEAGGQPRYLRILKNSENSDPGNPASAPTIDANRVAETLSIINSYLKRSDWPIVDSASAAAETNGGSLQNKYYNRFSSSSLREARMLELGLNIIEYVRAKESKLAVIQPFRGSWDAAAMAYVMGDSSHDTYFGISRTPYITELALWYGQATKNYTGWTGNGTADYMLTSIAAGDWMFKLKAELYLPLNYGLNSLELAGTYIGANLPSGGTGSADNPKNTMGASAPYWKLDSSNLVIYDQNGNPKSGTVISAGEYAVLTLPCLYLRQAPAAAPATKKTPASSVGVRVAYGAGTGNSLWNICPASLTDTIVLTIDTTGMKAEGSLPSMEVNDPRVNTNALDWTSSALNTLGTKNNANKVNTPATSQGTYEAQQDTDGDGKLSDASFYMPPPSGSTYTRADGTIDDNTKGQVMSVGELGYIHTGVEPCSRIGTGAGTKVAFGGIPWRTLRLQPNSADRGVVPDWAFMDLFTAPVTAPSQYDKYVYAPRDTTYGGRVNLNSKAEPFGLSRILPLAAVLQNCTYDATSPSATLAPDAALALATNIYNRTLSTTLFPGKQYGYQYGYDSPGEVVEISGIADTGEKSEELVRQISNLVTTRGNVFSVYSIGQAVKQKQNGKLVVTGEQRLQAMIERYLDATTNQVRFTPVYFRTLSP